MNDLNDIIQQYLQASIAGDHDHAEDILHQGRQAYPASGALLTLAAANAMQTGNPDMAEALYTEALQYEPELAVTRFQLGLLQYTSGRVQLAFLTWQPLDKLPEDHYLLCFKRAFAALAIDAFDDTLLLIERGVQANHENPPLNADMNMLAAEIQSLRGHAPAPEAAIPDESAAFMALAAYKQNQ